jgi:hypothetical protein
MAGLPWFKQSVDLKRDPRSLILSDILGDPRAWTYVVEMRMYLAERAPTGCVSGSHAAIAFERGSGWTGERGALISALRDAGFISVCPARDGEGTEIEDLDWAREQGAHVKKFETDAKKPRGNTHKVVSPSRDIGGTVEGPDETPRGESRELRVESREERTDLPPAAIASAGKAIQDGLPLAPLVGQKSPTKPRKSPVRPKAADPRHAPLVKALADAGYPFRDGRDAKAVSDLLRLADQREVTRGELAGVEVLRRARVGWGWVGYPACKSVTELRDNWGHYEREQEALGARPRDVTRGVARAEDMNHTGPGDLTI